MRVLSRAALFVFPFVVAACSAGPMDEGAANEGSGPIDDEREILNDAEVSQELGARPSYTLRSRIPLGEYSSNEGCAGGFDACDKITVKKVDGKVEVAFGFDGDVKTDAWVRNGVLLFSASDLSTDCDDPGCGNLIKATGVIYPVRDGDRWVPQVKVTYTAEFPYPEYEGDNEGEVRTVIRMKKQAQ
jgi:hypothetical protein